MKHYLTSRQDIMAWSVLLDSFGLLVSYLGRVNAKSQLITSCVIPHIGDSVKKQTLDGSNTLIFIQQHSLGNSLPSGCRGYRRKFFSCTSCTRLSPSGQCAHFVREMSIRCRCTFIKKNCTAQGNKYRTKRFSRTHKGYIQHGDHLWLLFDHLREDASVASS